MGKEVNRNEIEDIEQYRRTIYQRGKEEKLFVVYDKSGQKELWLGKEKLADIGENGEIKLIPGNYTISDLAQLVEALTRRDSFSLKDIEKQVTNERKMGKTSSSKEPKVENFEEKKKEIEKQRKEQEKNKNKNQQNKEETKDTYQENATDMVIDVRKKITENETFQDLVPEAKDFSKVVIRRTSGTEFEFIGITSTGKEKFFKTLVPMKGTNPTKNVQSINKDGTKVTKQQVNTIVAIREGENEGKRREGFTVKIGQYGIPEVGYYRESNKGEYMTIPVGMENTNQKQPEKQVRNYAQKEKNPDVKKSITKAKNNQEPTTEFEPNQEEFLIIQAAKRCKIGMKEFVDEYNKYEGTIEEKIEQAEEAINEQYRGNTRQRA